MRLFVWTTFVALGLSMSASADEQPAPTRIAVIDMLHVFKNYKKFNALREELQEEVDEADAENRRMAVPGQRLQNRLKELDEGSDEYVETQRALTIEKRKIEDFRKRKHREFLKRESDIYRTTYLEVSDQVEQYARQHGFGLVLRFERDPLSNATKPTDVVNQLRQQVVYHRDEDDITDAVLESLNERYEGLAASN